MEVERAFVGSGCNRIVNHISWGASGLVAFGAQNAVAIFCPQSAQILSTLPGHKANANCTQWLPTCKDLFKAQQQVEHYLLSGSADGVIMVWAVFIKEKKWKHVMQVPATHKKGVTCLTGMMLSQSVAILASTSSDGIVNVWELVFPSSIHAAAQPTSRPDDNVPDSFETIPDAVPTVLTQPPVEEQLEWHTSWPVSHKLYGHGNELFSLCCDHEGKLVASSCKAQSASVAEIWLWQVGSWKAVGRLQCHSLTVTQIEFSHDDSFLLAVSRDRQFSVFSIQKSGDEVSYQLIAKHEAHKRIIWSCSWNPHGHQFATGSRDKTVKLWTIEESTSSIKQLATLPPFKESVTALSWAKGLLAVGMDNGLIELWSLSDNLGFDVILALRLDPFLCHVSTVHRLVWRTKTVEVNDESGTLQLASCGADHCVRVFKIHMNH